VNKHGPEEERSDEWVIVFEPDRGLGLERSRLLGGRGFIFPGEDLRDEATRATAVSIRPSSHLP
jgi:hypothetical protein